MSSPNKQRHVLVVAALASLAVMSAHSAVPAQQGNDGIKKAPVLVELFTSESCSSCPPADRLLAKLQKDDPSVIVLSEHVTYWNESGWNDPYSSQESTDRQSAYVSRMGLSSSYTPQMVVDGQYEFVGSNANAAQSAIQKAGSAIPVEITISNLNADAGHVSLSISTAKVLKDAQLTLVLTQDEGTEKIAGGENGGRLLHHVQIARIIRPVADIKRDEAYQGDVSLDLPRAIGGSGWHVVAFLQQGSGGPILGVTAHAL